MTTGAALTSAESWQLQAVLESTVVSPTVERRHVICHVICHVMCDYHQITERLKLTLELLKRELAVATLQQKLGKEVCVCVFVCA